MESGRRPSPVLPGFVLGVGFGGFLDGLLYHQILQWHHLLSSEGCCSMRSLSGLEYNTVADGLFHLLTWVLLAAGTY